MDTEILKIDFLASPFKNDLIEFYCDGLMAAFKRKNVSCRILTPERDNPGSFIDEIKNHSPDFTLSFNGILPDKNGLLLSDVLEIPHIAYLTDFPLEYTPLAKAKNNYILVANESAKQFLVESGSKKVAIIPIGFNVDKEFTPHKKKHYPLVFFGSSLSPDTLLTRISEMESTYAKDLCLKAAQKLIKNPNMAIYEALISAMNETYIMLDYKKIDLVGLMDAIERLAHSLSLFKFLTEIDIPVDIFLSPSDEDELHNVFKGKHVFHSPPSLEESFHAIALSQITLISSLILKDQGSLDYYSSPVYGSLPLFIHQTNPKQIHEYLKDDAFRKEKVKKLKEKILTEDTWDTRVLDILKFIL